MWKGYEEALGRYGLTIVRGVAAARLRGHLCRDDRRGSRESRGGSAEELSGARRGRGAAGVALRRGGAGQPSVGARAQGPRALPAAFPDARPGRALRLAGALRGRARAGASARGSGEEASTEGPQRAPTTIQSSRRARQPSTTPRIAMKAVNASQSTTTSRVAEPLGPPARDGEDDREVGDEGDDHAPGQPPAVAGADEHTVEDEDVARDGLAEPDDDQGRAERLLDGRVGGEERRQDRVQGRDDEPEGRAHPRRPSAPSCPSPPGRPRGRRRRAPAR